MIRRESPRITRIQDKKQRLVRRWPSMLEETHTQLIGKASDVCQGCIFFPGNAEKDIVLEQRPAQIRPGGRRVGQPRRLVGRFCRCRQQGAARPGRRASGRIDGRADDRGGWATSGPASCRRRDVWPSAGLAVAGGCPRTEVRLRLSPAGCYINRKTLSHGMLHEVGCPHVGGAGDWDAGFGDVARRAKVCHRDRAALLAWAEREGVAVTPCADCGR
jgi:hypothetical protein